MVFIANPLVSDKEISKVISVLSLLTGTPFELTSKESRREFLEE